MNRNLRRTAGLAAVAALLPSAGALAAVVVITVKGVVPAGTIDTLGFFGTAGGMLDNDAFTEVFKLDTTTAGALHTDTSTEKSVFGGTFYPAPSPMLAASLNINGFTVHLSGQRVGSDLAQLVRGQSRQSQVATDESGAGGSVVQMTILSDVYGGLGAFPLAVDQAFGPTAVNGQSYGSFFYLNGGTGGFESFQLTPNTIQESLGAPEPGAWSLMLTGLGAVGGAFRMRRDRARA